VGTGKTASESPRWCNGLVCLSLDPRVAGSSPTAAMDLIKGD
jgi:hypothetical protein